MTKPNIIYILTDDMGYGDLGCNNPDSRIPTPNLDRLAKQGMRFTDAHAGSSVCTPSRYNILTGRYSWRSRLKQGIVWEWDAPLIDTAAAAARIVRIEQGQALVRVELEVFRGLYIRGTVVDPAGRSIGNVFVISEVQGRADDSGAFVIGPLLPGDYEIRAAAGRHKGL